VANLESQARSAELVTAEEAHQRLRQVAEILRHSYPQVAACLLQAGPSGRGGVRPACTGRPASL
jgi:hypothetical protein